MYETSAFSVVSGFMSASSELLDMYKRNDKKALQYGHKQEFFHKKLSSGNSEMQIILHEMCHYIFS